MGRHNTGDRGQRYEFTCDDGSGGRLVLGWSNDPKAFTTMVKRHPVWFDLKVLDRLNPPPDDP
jgi:hypothetical protein